MNKIAVCSFLVICTITLIQGNIFKTVIDDGIYSLIDTYVKDQYKDNPRKAECMSEDFRRNRIADKFYTADIITNPDKLSRELQPYIDAADLKCDVVAFLLSPWGIGILVLIACLLALSCICCLIRCICR
ncbi:hypothetical protein Bhyg_05968 [Pseudolycoriella hygida]|uniref:Uncharacterized protein n=1 Tax=Pseudolycoriella hygida TaxID=35572 RepID=A0A9Q0S2D7_9DIPT|nr:hypothetical protein Bhyg_05968 [Pseudolycoriella hygida]